MTEHDRPSSAHFAGLPQARCDVDLQRYFSRRIGNRQDVRELTQEVWLRLCRVNDRERLREPMAYVYRTAANVLAEFRLRRSQEPVTFDSDTAERGAASPPFVAPDELAEREQTQRDLLLALAGLTPALRQIVWMRLCEGRSFEEIGTKVGFTTATARRYYFRAVKTLWKAEWA